MNMLAGAAGASLGIYVVLFLLLMRREGALLTIKVMAWVGAILLLAMYALVAITQTVQL